MQLVVEMRSIGVSDRVYIGQLTSIIDFVPSRSLSIVLEGFDQVEVVGLQRESGTCQMENKYI